MKTISTTLQNGQLQPIIAITLTAICFSLYWFIAANENIKYKIFAKVEEDIAWIRYVTFQKLVGVLFLGLIPAIVIFTMTDYSWNELGVNFNEFKQSAFYSCIIGGLILLLNYFATNKPDRLISYPQMRLPIWTTRIFLINAITWAAYLFAYEFLFRGVLLFLCYDAFGFWVATAINISLYATTHIPKGAGETAGTFPYGLVLCYLTIMTGSIFIAFITHLIMAVSNDLFSIYHNPAMRFKK